ncbi:MAG: hypothetical protein HRK26_02750 [Rickettsiaceae bacterium H1]|nr:hypothetical protein [Rickettsiaceae bacterium H1]
MAVNYHYNPHVHNVDLSTSFNISVYDQGELGSCTSNGLAFLIQYLQHAQQASKENLGIPSRLFIYFDERLIEGNIGQDAGAAIIDGVKVLGALGICPETVWPYVI